MLTAYCYREGMSFSLRFGKAELDRRPSATGAAAPPMSNAGAFTRGLALGFVASFIVFDTALLQGATVAAALRALSRLLGH